MAKPAERPVARLGILQNQQEADCTQAPQPQKRAASWRTIAVILCGILLATGLVMLSAVHRAAPAVATDWLNGSSWAVDLRGRDGITYTGTMEVNRSVGAGAYRGYLKIGFEDPAGHYEAVQEDALITVEGNHVTVLSSRPVVITENGEYVPDNFYLTRQGGTVLQGIEKDVLQVGGTVTLTRNAKR